MNKKTFLLAAILLFTALAGWFLVKFFYRDNPEKTIQQQADWLGTIKPRHERFK